MNSIWRRWRPQSTTMAPRDGQSVVDPFLAAENRLKGVTINRRAWRKNQDFTELNALIDGACGHAVGLDRQNGAPLERAEAWLYALALQAPRAAVAQELMDKHPHGYHNKEHRLLELIDFNDAFDGFILALPREWLPHVQERVKTLLDAVCKKAGTRCLSNEQYHAVVHGLSREIAVYLGVQKEGFEAELTNRHEDAFGIDMRIIEPSTLKEVSVDIKTYSSYRYRVEELHREGRLSDEGLLMALRNGFTAVMNGRGQQQKRVVTWRIDHEVLGEVVDFEFQNTTLLVETLRAIFLRYGEKIS